MEGVDVTIFYSNDASEWSNYLMWCFQELQSPGTILEQDPHQQQGLQVRQQCIENLVLPLTMPVIGFYRRAKVQIVILSPDFLEFVVRNANSCLGSMFEPSRVLALMCGVSESEVSAQHRASLVSFDVWKRMTVIEDDRDFVMSLITAALKALQSCPTEQFARQVSKAFRLYPSKTREGNAQVMVQLKNPMPENQIVAVSLETENESVPIDAKCSNPYTLKFVVPDRFFGFSQHVHVRVKCGSESLGVRPLKCESKMAELHQLLSTIVNPFEFMCQTLGLSSSMLENVDRILVESLRKNLPKSGFPLFDFDKDTCRRRVAAELPTLLHFAAKMGLQEVCAALLDCPGAAAACRIRNTNGLGPVDLAQLEGHSCLANMIDNFMKLSETAQMYIYMKSVTEGGCSADYENLRTAFTQSIEEVGALVSPFVANESTGLVGQFADQQGESTRAPTDTESIKESKKLNAASCVLYSQSQQELLQLLDDFKNEKYTIDEAESMFDCWQLRQKSHNSFKEKQEQLMTMRQRYDRVQKKCQQEGKKSALEKFRTFLVRNMKSSSHQSAASRTNYVHVRSKINEESTNDAQGTLPIVSSNGRRPYSNMSNGSSRSSSSLSNRSSTLSGFSVSSATDSGTQSDVGEEPNVYEPTLVQHHSSARQLNTPIVSRMMENLQYMYTPSSTKGPPLPVRNNDTAAALLTPLSQNGPSSPASAAAKTFTSSCRGRNPMPVPRVVPTVSPRASGLKLTLLSSPSLIIPGTLDKNIDGCSLRYSPPSLATNLDNDQHNTPSSSLSPIRDGYLCMETTTTIAMRRRRSKSPQPQMPQSGDPDYSNVIYGPDGVYMDMSSQGSSILPTNDSSPKPARRIPATLGTASMIHQNMSDCDFSDRCDSVPDFPPPAPPMMILNRTRPNLPPPLPPRNQIVTNRAK